MALKNSQIVDNSYYLGTKRTAGTSVSPRIHWIVDPSEELDKKTRGTEALGPEMIIIMINIVIINTNYIMIITLVTRLITLNITITNNDYK